MISPEHRAFMSAKHRERRDYASNGWKWHRGVRALMQANGCKDVLDYGAGKQSLARLLSDIDIRSYDPAVPEIAAPPEPADLVVCTQVLQDVEPHYLEAVIADLYRLARVAIFVAQKRDAEMWTSRLLAPGWRPYRLAYKRLRAGVIEPHQEGSNLALLLRRC